MAKDNKKLVQAITSQEENFAQWYTDICVKAELVEYSSVKGFIILRPYGQAIWELIQKDMDARFKATGHENVAMPVLILSACHNMIRVLTHDDTLNLSKFISREQLSPTAAYQRVHDRVIAPMHTHLTRLIAAYTGRDANDTATILHTHALLGEILAFRLGRETILLRTGWTQFDEDKAAQIGEVIACHLDLILQGLTQRSLKS